VEGCSEIEEMIPGQDQDAGPSLSCKGSGQGPSLLGVDPSLYPATVVDPTLYYWYAPSDPFPLDALSIDDMGINARSGNRRLANNELVDLLFYRNVPTIINGVTVGSTTYFLRIFSGSTDAAGRGRYGITYSTDYQAWNP